ncbi:hypothetical protein CDL15_Pgr021737 [Punica granatum]|uniref:Protein kinase domain-containing protein n=1 Tax=Punica granatum TaxID=22663 RepID=A0A218WSG2_PUNGR|nr:hypothetical protein CDL15_Pgr021737 [Punica granatum]
MSLSLLNSPKSAKHLNSCFLRTVVTNSNWEDMLRASAEVLGKGLLATSYEAYLEDGPMIVVKMLKLAKVATTEFEKLIEQISSIRHKNVATLRAYLLNRRSQQSDVYSFRVLLLELMVRQFEPAQVMARRSQQSDVYSFGVILLELLVREFEPTPSDGQVRDFASWGQV